MRKKGDGYDVWETTIDLITKGEWAGWYEMRCTTTCSSSGVTFTLYNKLDQPFKAGKDSSIAWPVYVAQIMVNGKVIPINGLAASESLAAEIDFEFVNGVPAKRLTDNLAANPDAPEHEPTAPSVSEETTPSTPAEGTGDGASTETPAEGSAE